MSKPSKDQFKEYLKYLLESKYLCESITDSDNIKSLNLDSLDLIEIQLEIEMNYDVEFKSNIELIFYYPNVTFEEFVEELYNLI